MGRLNTTTYDQRVQKLLEQLAKITTDIENPTILDVGAGGVLYGTKSLIKPGSPARFLFKPLESLLRRIPFLPLQTFEPFNIQDAFADRSPSITVLDIEPRVVAAVTRQSQGDIQAKVHDIGDGSFEPCVDIAVCHAALHDPVSQDLPTMVHNLVQSVRVGGYILFVSNFGHLILKEKVEEINHGIFRRIE